MKWQFWLIHGKHNGKKNCFFKLPLRQAGILIHVMQFYILRFWNLNDDIFSFLSPFGYRKKLICNQRINQYNGTLSQAAWEKIIHFFLLLIFEVKIVHRNELLT